MPDNQRAVREEREGGEIGRKKVSDARSLDFFRGAGRRKKFFLSLFVPLYKNEPSCVHDYIHTSPFYAPSPLLLPPPLPSTNSSHSRDCVIFSFSTVVPLHRAHLNSPGLQRNILPNSRRQPLQFKKRERQTARQRDTAVSSFDLAQRHFTHTHTYTKRAADTDTSCMYVP